MGSLKVFCIQAEVSDVYVLSENWPATANVQPVKKIEYALSSKQDWESFDRGDFEMERQVARDKDKYCRQTPGGGANVTKSLALRFTCRRIFA